MHHRESITCVAVCSRHALHKTQTEVDGGSACDTDTSQGDGHITCAPHTCRNSGSLASRLSALSRFTHERRSGRHTESFHGVSASSIATRAMLSEVHGGFGAAAAMRFVELALLRLWRTLAAFAPRQRKPLLAPMVAIARSLVRVSVYLFRLLPLALARSRSSCAVAEGAAQRSEASRALTRDRNGARCDLTRWLVATGN